MDGATGVIIELVSGYIEIKRCVCPALFWFKKADKGEQPFWWELRIWPLIAIYSEAEGIDPYAQ